MKKKLAILFLLVAILTMCGCGATSSSKDGSDWTKQFAKETSTPTATATATPEATPDANAEKFKGIDVKVVDKKNYKKDAKKGRFSPFIAFVTNVKNTTNKDIKAIYGTITVSMKSSGTPLGKAAFNLTTQVMKKGKTTKFNRYGLNVNEHNSAAVDLYNAKYSNLEFNFEFTKVLFKDGTSIVADK